MKKEIIVGIVGGVLLTAIYHHADLRYWFIKSLAGKSSVAINCVFKPKEVVIRDGESLIDSCLFIDGTKLLVLKEEEINNLHIEETGDNEDVVKMLLDQKRKEKNENTLA
jgi:hypothetical protein